MPERDLTRDEIRAACEAVGWRWRDDHPAGWAEDDGGDDRFWVYEEGGDATLPCFVCDAIALLEAWGEQTGRDYAIRRDGDGFTLTALSDKDERLGSVAAHDLSTAAVRAVNAWVKGRSDV